MTKYRSTIYENYRQRFPRSAALASEAARVVPRVVTHDARHLEPFPLYMSHALGSHKWDVDGNEYVDYAGGHGSLFLGHSHPDIVRAVQAQMARGAHLGFSHDQEVRWAELIVRLVPCADRVEFTMSGTESVMLALRVARGYTGRQKIIKFQEHFHGWYDQVYQAMAYPYDRPSSLGLTDSELGSVVVLPPNRIEPVRETLAGGDIAAVILEPSGARGGFVPVDRQYLRELREETTKAGTVLIFDEVITGFRYSPGGAQEYFGVTPDLSTFGKIVGGGLPAGAVGGRAEIMEVLEYGRPAEPGRASRVSHTGTFNANPLAAAAGVVMLEAVSTGLPHLKANETARNLRRKMNEALDDLDVSGRVFGDCSMLHLLLAPPDRCPPLTNEGLIPSDYPLELLAGNKGVVSTHLKRALLLEGVDVLSDHGWVSAAHDEDDVEETARAFRRALNRLLAEDLVSRR